MERTGGCLCGAVRFRAVIENRDYGVCHCKMCQRWTGLALAGIMVQPDKIEIEGQDHVGTYRSSDIAVRCFCTRCGSPMWLCDLNEDGSPKAYELPLGVIDDPSGLTLHHEIFVDRRIDSIALAGDHIQDTEAEYFEKLGFVPQPTEG
ncbi:MAG: GFA family protein [Rhodobacter sp.]|nr:GFA family protein [Rhodobacter sp.]